MMENLSDPASRSLQFIMVTRPGRDWKNNNEHIVRSHVMRNVRRGQKLKKKSLEAQIKSSGSSTVLNLDGHNTRYRQPALDGKILQP